MAIDFSDDPRGVQLQLLIERAKYDRYVASEAQRLLLDTFEEVATTIASPEFRNLSSFDQARAFSLFAEVNSRLSAGYGQLTSSVVNEMQGYSALESAVAQAQIAAAVDTGSSIFAATLTAFLPTAVTASIATLAVQGNTIATWYKDQLSGMSVATTSAIQQGLIQGLSTRQISANIVSQGTVDVTTPIPNVLARAQRDATAITRTATTAVHNDAAMKSYQAAGASITSSYRFTAVLDSRTTPICRSLDGKSFKYDDPNRKEPPMHWNCRSTTIPILDGPIAEKLGLGSNGPDHSMQSYDDWLQDQSDSTQDDILGPSRASMYRAGSLTLASAIDSDGRSLTLSQLRAAVSPVQTVGAQ